MLRHLCIVGFKSLGEVKVSFPRLTVLFGPNAAGKSNLLESRLRNLKMEFIPGGSSSLPGFSFHLQKIKSDRLSSPPILLFSAMLFLREARSLQSEDGVALLNVRRGAKGTEVHPFDITGPLFKDREIMQALTSETEDGLFEGLILRGMLDE